MDEIRYTVTGMSCGHCVVGITEEVSQVSGVSEVSVDLPANEVTVRGTTVDDERVRAAITEAGYEVAGLATA
ncbi:heavy-metal-associated domain-containing protein [Streptomyces rapamycinicus]|uniref:Transporter n=2 Tax=Streptomyces rapamycinicus TaxID=1226757 RepID=A0A0A0N815_STRRN|nr:heavy-metal-associated domain-containing protein [Streptomyces rapamycinicus]AGP53296.1 transporter [Streptomyces rapamycinicus NRRL 5491]MBB4780781.1 copper chaperone CopZ [Streptomyces rapamycinicus]RLV74570.1 transporter [Streptomyces rapamycinicus NRRL 5491]UTO61473.1 heavy-metal-associated domain-containing protein [Streptomyces rapamycinicus]UTP29420.1 heavy-metal-associated domain-containing protein [Streptomyces rapamycinicus NRRL 5491]